MTYTEQRNLMKSRIKQFGTTYTKKGPGRVHRNGPDPIILKRRQLLKELQESFLND